MIDEKKIYTEALRLVRESPDNIYKADFANCSYINGKCSNGATGCLFGQSISNVYPKQDLEPLEGESIGGILEGRVIANNENYSFTSGFNTIGSFSHFLSCVQHNQDGGLNWKEAWNRAINVVSHDLEPLELETV